jgi:hypothetical protein
VKGMNVGLVGEWLPAVLRESVEETESIHHRLEKAGMGKRKSEANTLSHASWRSEAGYCERTSGVQCLQQRPNGGECLRSSTVHESSRWDAFDLHPTSTSSLEESREL